MFRGALAKAGAHEAALRDAIPEVLHPQGDAFLARERGDRRDDMYGAPFYGRLRARGIIG